MYFSNTIQPYTQYPLHVILYTLEQYNKGYPVKKAKTLTGKNIVTLHRFKLYIPGLKDTRTHLLFLNFENNTHCIPKI